jgi:hypothetical protein
MTHRGASFTTAQISEFLQVGTHFELQTAWRECLAPRPPYSCPSHWQAIGLATTLRAGDFAPVPGPYA